MDTEDGADSGSSSGGNMTTVSQHDFGDKFDKPALTISIIENMKEEYGLFVWPCSVILAEYVWQQRLQFSGVSVLELGAGTCLPGLVAAKLGLDVTLTDDSNKLEVLDNMRRVCDLNQLNCKVSYHYKNVVLHMKTAISLEGIFFLFFKKVSDMLLLCRCWGLTWGVWDESIFTLKPKLILGADVLYDASAFDDLFATVTFLLQNSPGSVFITTYHNRR
ncbi:HEPATOCELLULAR CARCINOMA-ASSOCIATED ANTIGEN [Salix koriyanagi]|uniref:HEPATOCELLULAR CARCINOMA-ASSOCIATED ANTIGEN n=1 Tax=Salix koriyanagi TaxID=2511006 RepID=A0A9Q0P6A7_9ROSI|nr:HEPATOCELLULAR CARCINOMA-ASSOCIATED ANTIGEN [Salix koriyanagi]